MRPLATALLFLSPAVALSQRTIDLTGKPAASYSEPFTTVKGVHELSPDLALVSDWKDFKLVLVDFSRGSARQLGSRGSGPNEYRIISEPVPAPTGAYVIDAQQRRAFRIDRQGRIAEMKQLPDNHLLHRIGGSDAAGRLYFRANDYDNGRFLDSVAIVRWDPSTNKVETVGKVWSGGRVIGTRGGSQFSTTREATPFPHIDAWVPLPDGRLALLDNDAFRIDIVGAGGSVTTGKPIPFTPIAITARDRDWYRDRNTPGRMSIGTKDGSAGPQRPGMEWEDALFPAVLPAFVGGDVVVSPEGDIWVPRSFASTDKNRRYEIYDTTGKLTGTAVIDPNSRVVGFGAKTVYVARTNPDDDLVYLSRYAR